MSRDKGTEDQGKKGVPAGKEEKKVEASELTEDDLKHVSGGGALTFGREKLKGTSKTQGDFSLGRRPGR